MDDKRFRIRCLRCHGGRIEVSKCQKTVTCPYCGQKWRLTWPDSETVRIRSKIRGEKDLENYETGLLEAGIIKRRIYTEKEL